VKISWVLITIFFIGCNNKMVPRESINASNYSNYQIQCDVNVLAKNEIVGVNLALRKGFEKLFFIGFPGTISQTPLITDDVKINKEKFLDEFINEKKYAPFITSINHNKNKSSMGQQFIATNFVVDLQSLRRYLSSNGTTRNFGF